MDIPALKSRLKVHAKEYDRAIVHGLWQYHGRAALKVLPKLTVPTTFTPTECSTLGLSKHIL